MSLDLLRRYWSIGAMALWLAAFGAEAVRLARWTTDFWRVAGRLETAAAALRQNARDVVELANRNKSQSLEVEFLNALPNVLPQERGYLRTQRVIGEETEVLRRKVGGRLKGALHILVDSKANKLYLKKGMKLLWQADCSVGRGGTLVSAATGRRWEFVTPRGEFRVVWKDANPVWTKPDWAFVEQKQPVPPPDDPGRKVPGELGAYVLSLGDGYLIHGTKDEKSLGRPVSHGCVRLGAADLQKVFETVPIGTKVYIY
ncbi:MAG: L,D-transpeptidase [Elusimicrobia bacterium]|nr:L,D-transpeptidase [Elusimicrobiota bacterium]